MKTVILAGGFGTRLSEETGVLPKPMVRIGGMPILWHIMKMYSFYGFNDFVICCGYKGHVIKEYFANYYLMRTDLNIDLKSNSISYLNNSIEPWNITLVDTGENTLTGGRLKRVQEHVGNERFFLTYGDGVSDVNIKELLDFHIKQDSYATLTAVKPPGRFGAISLESKSNKITKFREKPKSGDHESAWINGGFFVCEPNVFDFISGDRTIWERAPMEKMSQEMKLSAYQHSGYWQNMDSLRDKHVLEEVWSSGNPPWKKW